MDEEKGIVIVSDGTGRTARRLMDAVLVQYRNEDLEHRVVNVYQNIRSRMAIDDILQSIDDEFLVLYSLISRKLSGYFNRQLKERGILCLDVLDPMLDTMSKFLGVHPDYKPGILHIVDDRYYKKIDAIGYTVEHDDGQGQHIFEADIILLGLSRSCKTPISMYLACDHGYKVANIPVIRDAELTRQLLIRLEKVPKSRIVGLLMQPETLAYVREERSQHLATGSRRAELGDYYDIREVAKEFRFARELFQSQEWATIDVTRRAIEEVSVEILRTLKYID